MKNKMLISAESLMQLQRSGSCLIVDCRFNLGKAEAGYEAYLEAHIPNAVYANLDKDLSSPVTKSSGRHPLPGATQFAAFLAGIGWHPGRIIVAYDDIGGAFAARLWWLMKYFGHDEVVLLDGGFPAWLAAGYAKSQGEDDLNVPATSPVSLSAHDEMVLSAANVEDGLRHGDLVLLDARAPERYRGDVEPIDKVAGHVPGAVNMPFGLNLDEDKHFKPQADIRALWRAHGGAGHAEQVVHMCGSGVTACFNQFAAELVGLEGSRIYAGSWSEWIQDPVRGVEVG